MAEHYPLAQTCTGIFVALQPFPRTDDSPRVQRMQLISPVLAVAKQSFSSTYNYWSTIGARVL